MRHLFIIPLLAILFTACGGDDFDENEQPTYPIEILGNWAEQAVETTVTYTDGSIESSTTLTEGAKRLVVAPNGIATALSLQPSGRWTEDYRAYWAFSDPRFMLRTPSGDVYYTLRTLNTTTMVLETTTKTTTGGDDDNDGELTPSTPPSETTVASTNVKITYSRL